MFEYFSSSLLVFTAIITMRFNRMVTGQAMAVMATINLKRCVIQVPDEFWPLRATH